MTASRSPPTSGGERPGRFRHDEETRDRTGHDLGPEPVEQGRPGARRAKRRPFGAGPPASRPDRKTGHNRRPQPSGWELTGASSFSDMRLRETFPQRRRLNERTAFQPKRVCLISTPWVVGEGHERLRLNTLTPALFLSFLLPDLNGCN